MYGQRSLFSIACIFVQANVMEKQKEEKNNEVIKRESEIQREVAKPALLQILH